MSTHVKIALTLTFLGVISIGGWRYIEPMVADVRQSNLSDSAENGIIQIGIDGWIGYFPLCSPEMSRSLRQEGYGLRCTDDAADYSERFEKLKNNDYHFVVATVDSYLLNGEKYNFPGPIITVLDESKGGDAIVTRKDIIPNVEALKKVTDTKVSLTLDSPSHHLIKAVATHFEVDLFKKKQNLISSNGSEDALRKLEAGESDVAVLWEPDVSKALENDSYIRLLGTEDTQQLIVDILISSQSVAKKDPKMVLSLLKAYFNTLKYYRNNPNELVDDISDHYNIRKSVAESMLTGVHWATLTENADRWYSIDSNSFSEDALVQTINSAANILVENKDFSSTPVPSNDPYHLISSVFIKEIYQKFANTGGFSSTGAAQENTKKTFLSLTDSQWNKLQEVGSLKSRKITFSSGTSELTPEGQQEIDMLIRDIIHYPNFRIEVRGHTSDRGDVDANLALSQERANTVTRYMNKTHDIEKNRIRAIGFGGLKPLPKRASESNRSYRYRLPRVEIVLVREII